LKQHDDIVITGYFEMAIQTDSSPVKKIHEIEIHFIFLLLITFL